MIQKKVLSNGLTVVYQKQDMKSVTINVSVKAGCLYEPDEIMGVSHFLEHMLFNGTTNRTQLQILSEVENLGGELNAATASDRTYYYVKMVKKHFDIALDVISDMIQNSNFPNELYEREKGIVLDEINMVHDTPRHQQWILFHDALFKDHPASKRVLGTEETITNLTREQLFDYYRKMYVPENMVITIVGNVENVFEKVEEKFVFTGKKPSLSKIPLQENEGSNIIETREIQQSYMILGYSVPKRTHEDSYPLDIIKAVLGRGQSGWIFDEVRNKRGLAYDVGAYLDTSVDYGFFGVYINCHKKNFEKVKKLIFEQFERLQGLTEKELIDAKNYIEGDFILEHEDTEDEAQEISFWELCNEAEDFDKYVKRIKSVKLEEVKEIAKKYFTENYSEAIIQQKN
ncbi:hypothetical protein C0585_06300 [Candidatus Woesearchaeota archaeon]|nr:MAG: hypothetical protein C0585_06300 [Candidatus Woesearchaeota archaeon]